MEIGENVMRSISTPPFSFGQIAQPVAVRRGDCLIIPIHLGRGDLMGPVVLWVMRKYYHGAQFLDAVIVHGTACGRHAVLLAHALRRGRETVDIVTRFEPAMDPRPFSLDEDDLYDAAHEALLECVSQRDLVIILVPSGTEGLGFRIAGGSRLRYTRPKHNPEGEPVRLLEGELLLAHLAGKHRNHHSIEWVFYTGKEAHPQMPPLPHVEKHT